MQQPGKGHLSQFFESFSSLRWLEALIDFSFRLLALMAEPFLAFNLIISAIDYGTHGQFLSGHKDIFLGWVIVQAVALEGSGGVTLAAALEARHQNDDRKFKLCLGLALALMTVGGVMVIVEANTAIKGFDESTLPDWYFYSMNVLRAFVSLGYLAICRTKHLRYGGAPAVPQATVPDIQAKLGELSETLRGLGTTTENCMQQLEATTELRIRAVIETLQSVSDGNQRQIEEITHSFAAALRFHLQEQLLPITETLSVLPSLSQQLSQVEEAAQYQLRTVTEEVTRVKVTLEQQTMTLPKLAERIVSQDAPSHHQLPAPSGRKSRRVKRAESVEAKRPPADFDKGGFVYECLRADPTISIGAIQRKAAQIGQTISVGYISERRKAFFEERFPKGVNTETVETTEE